MATRTSNRSTKAVKFIDSTGDSDLNEDMDQSADMKGEQKKSSIRTNHVRRKRTNDDEDWSAQNEQIDDEEDDDDIQDETINYVERDATKKFKTNRSVESVYDFGDASRKWSKSAQQRSTGSSKTSVNESGKPVEKLMCSYCNYTTAKKYLLQRHLKSHSTERPHKCAYCERSFKTTIQLTNHVNTHLGVKPFQCKFCIFSFTTSGELIRHVRYKHTLEKPHRCEECGYATVELSKLRRHIRTHTGEKPYACPHCSYCSPDTFKLKRHLRVHTGERPYQCTICNFRFTQSNSLKAHMLTHQAEKPSFPCSYCPSVMARKSDLRYHIGKQHARQSQPLPCNKCDEDFPDKYSLRMHGKTHKGQTIHSCTDCEFSATTSQQLEDHMNKHRGMRPFQCSECGLMFAARADLRAHVTRTHRTPAASSMNNTNNNRPRRQIASVQNGYAGVSSVADGDDQQRQRQHPQQDDDFRCPICHRQFTSARLLDRHTFVVHEPKPDSHETHDYHGQDQPDHRTITDDDDVHDYADDELEEKEKEKHRASIKHELEQTDTRIDEAMHERVDYPTSNEPHEEDDLASYVEDIFDEEQDDDEHHHLPMIRSVSSAGRKQQNETLMIQSNSTASSSRKFSIGRTSFAANHEIKTGNFDVFGFDG